MKEEGKNRGVENGEKSFLKNWGFKISFPLKFEMSFCHFLY